MWKQARDASRRPVTGKARRGEGRNTGRRVDRDPAMTGKPHLDPCVRVALANDGLVEDRVVVTGRVAGGEPSRDAETAQHQRLGGGELLAVAGLDVEQEPIDRVAARRHRWQVERVAIVVLEIRRDRHHGVEGVRREEPRRQMFGPLREKPRVQVSVVAAGRVVDVFIRAQDLGRVVREVRDDRVGLPGPQPVGRVEGAVGILSQPGDRRVQALDRVGGVDHARQRAQNAKRLDEGAEVVRRRGWQKARRHVRRQLAVRVVRRRPDTVPVGVEYETAPVRGSPGADVHHRRVAEPAAVVEVDAARRAGRIASHLDQRKGRALHVAPEAREVRQRDHERRDGDARRLRHDDEQGESRHQRRDEQHGQWSGRRPQLRVQATHVRREPETRETQHPQRRQHNEGVVPGVDRRQIEDREADPQARVAVAAGLEVEARDRDQQDCEVGLRQHATEQGER